MSTFQNQNYSEKGGVDQLVDSIYFQDHMLNHLMCRGKEEVSNLLTCPHSSHDCDELNDTLNNLNISVNLYRSLLKSKLRLICNCPILSTKMTSKHSCCDSCTSSSRDSGCHTCASSRQHSNCARCHTCCRSCCRRCSCSSHCPRCGRNTHTHSSCCMRNNWSY